MESSATPPPAALPPAPQLPSPRSGLDSFLHQLPGTSVLLYALKLIQPALLAEQAQRAANPNGSGPPWVLLGFVALAVPAFASLLSGIAGRSLKPRT